MTEEEREVVLAKEQETSREVYRLLQMARATSGPALLEGCLEGRELSVENVEKLFKFARRHFHPALPIQKVICGVALEYLATSMTVAELKKLKRIDTRSVLDELDESEKEESESVQR
jgi:hypothetical protein